MIINEDNFALLIAERLCKEYQSLWLISLENYEMKVFRWDEGSVILNAISTANELKYYDEARMWYINNHVVDEDKERMLEATRVEKIIENIKDGNNYVLEYRRINGSNINYNQLYFAKLGDENDFTHFFMGFRDIDSNKRAELDELTGLYKRKEFIRRCELVLQEYPDTAFDLVLSDFVDFKDINERYGAKCGDMLLKFTAHCLKNHMQKDLIVGRYGGDQFVVFIRHELFDKYIAESGTGFFEIPEKEGLPASVIKVGIYRNIRQGDSVLVCCDKAHVAVNSIKHTYGQNYAEYDNEMKKQNEKQRIIENDMRKALKEGQFKVYYQPKHATATGKIVGAEALIRWIHPEFGFMSPADFIPIFEKNGFIVEIDKYVFRRTCENLNRWKQENIEIVPISVNASKLTVESPEMIMNIEQSMIDNNVDARYVHIEITESLMSDDLDGFVRKLEPIKAKNIEIELDDFGSGYSSINMLSALPLDVIKLDMSFMKQFGDVKRSKVLESCVNLAKNLGYRTVSEGVETEEQMVSLKNLGVDVIQGYYFSKPLSEENFEEYLKSK